VLVSRVARGWITGGGSGCPLLVLVPLLPLADASRETPACDDEFDGIAAGRGDEEFEDAVPGGGGGDGDGDGDGEGDGGGGGGGGGSMKHGSHGPPQSMPTSPWLRYPSPHDAVPVQETEIGSSGYNGELDNKIIEVENDPVLAGMHSTVMVSEALGSS